MLASFVFLGLAVFSKPLDFSKIGNPADAVLLSLAVTAGYIGIVYFAALAWKMTMQFIYGGLLPYKTLATVYVKANIAKYLPGNVMHFAGRNILAGRLGLSQLDTAFSSVTEILILALTACIWSAALAFDRLAYLIRRSVAMMQTHALLFAGAAVALLAIISALVLFIHKRGYVQKYRKFLTLGFLRLLLRLFVMYSITLLVSGFFMMLMFPVLFGASLTPHTVMLIIAAYIVSWVSGYIVPGAPGGLGIRESVLVLILSSVFPQNQILLVAFLNRLLSIAGDAVAFALRPLLLRNAAVLDVK